MGPNYNLGHGVEVGGEPRLLGVLLAEVLGLVHLERLVTVMAYVVMAYMLAEVLGLVHLERLVIGMAYTVMAYIVMAYMLAEGSGSRASRTTGTCAKTCV